MTNFKKDQQKTFKQDYIHTIMDDQIFNHIGPYES